MIYYDGHHHNVCSKFLFLTTFDPRSCVGPNSNSAIYMFDVYLIFDPFPGGSATGLFVYNISIILQYL